MSEEKKKEKERYEITQMVTETAPAYLDNQTGESLTQFELIKRIANDVESLNQRL